MLCKKCGQSFEGNQCPFCGFMQDESPENDFGDTNEKNKSTAGFLQIFAGALGLGRFYLGDSSTGILQIIVSMITCGIGGLIWGLIDGILILEGKANIKNRKD